MIISTLTDRGLVRKHNEDYYYAGDSWDVPLFIVADGMGGHKAGDVASKMAVDIIKDVILTNKSNLNSEDMVISTIKGAIKKANEEIYLKSLSRKECAGMGTTVTLAYILERNIYIGHVGDSRAYLIETDKINQLTEDHSLINELVKNGSITLEEGKDHPQKNIITRAVGTSKLIYSDTYKIGYKSGDILLLCSDGLSNMVEDKEIFEIIKDAKNVKDACEGLIVKAKENGGLDNVTVIMIKFK